MKASGYWFWKDSELDAYQPISEYMDPAIPTRSMTSQLERKMTSAELRLAIASGEAEGSL